MGWYFSKICRKIIVPNWILDIPPDSCSPPQLALLNGSDTENREQRIQEDYSQVKEVKFSTSVGAQKDQRICKIKCIAGQWVGPLCTEQQGE